MKSSKQQARTPLENNGGREGDYSDYVEYGVPPYALLMTRLHEYGFKCFISNRIVLYTVTPSVYMNAVQSGAFSKRWLHI